MKIDITAFDGIRPRVGAHLLDEGQATIARNCRLGSGMLKPLGVMTEVLDDNDTPFQNLDGKKSIYRWQDTWLFFSDRRSFAPGPALSIEEMGEDEDGGAITDETKVRRLFMSEEDGGLLVYREGNPAWKLGVPAPVSAPTVTLSGSTVSSATTETRVYVFTYVNTLGQESAPSPASASINVQGNNVVVGGLSRITPSGYCPIQFVRIYRLAVGNEGAGYMFVAETKNASYTDKVASKKLGEALPSLGWRIPSERLKMITAVGNNGYAAFYGNELRFSEPLYPYAWPDALSHVLEYEIVGIVRSSVYLYIFTKGSVYYMSLDDVTTAVPVKMEGTYICLSAKGIVSIPGGAVFPCHDGLYFVGAGYSKPFKLTARYFDEPQWAALWTGDAIGAYSNGTLYYFLQPNQEHQRESNGLLMKLGIDEGGNASIQNLTTTNAQVYVMYADDTDSFLYVVAQYGNRLALMRWEGDVNADEPTSKTNMTAVWQSKSFLTGNKINLSCAIVEQDIDDEPVYAQDDVAVQEELPTLEEEQVTPYTQIIFYRDGKEFYRREISDREAFVLPAGFTGRTLQMRIETNVWVRRVAVAESMAELFA